MKRKSPLEPIKPLNEEILKPQLKKAKPNNYKGPSLKPININRNLGSQNKTIASTSDSSADRSSVSLLSNDKPNSSIAKENILNVEEAKICKNLNEAYKEIDLNTEAAAETNKVNGHEIKGLKDARKIAKLNKLGGTILDNKISFPKKILKNTTNNTKHPKSSTIQPNKEEEKKSEEEPGNQILEVIIDLSSKSTPEPLVTEDANTPNASTAEEESPKEEPLTGEAHPIESLLTKFEGVPVVETKMVSRRNPRENKWHNRIEQEGGKDEAEKKPARQKSSRSKNVSSPKVSTRTIMTRASSAKARAANAQGNIQEEFKSPGKPASKVIRATRRNTPSVGRVNKSASNSEKKVLPSEEEMNEEQLEIETSMLEEVKEENDRLKKDMVMQEIEIEEAKKEREELIKMIEAIENEKYDILKEAEDKEKDLKQKENDIETIRKQLVLSEFYRTNLNNYIQDLRGNLRIYCRIKPVHELKKTTVFYPQKQQYITGCQVDVSYDENGRQVLPRIALNSLEIGVNSQSRSTYYFDRVFDETLTQEDVFEEILPFIQSAVDGEKVCILAYGQTGSGKTYTIEGPHFDHISNATCEVGILPRAVDFILREATRLEVQNTTIEIQLACMEIYNENLTDLLAPPEERVSTGSFSFQGINNFVANIRDKFKGKDKEKEAEKDNSKLVINYVGNKITIAGLTWTSIRENQQLFETINKALKARAMDTATWKERSTKSHCIYKLKLIRSDGKEGVLNIVDLGGCEKPESQPADMKSSLDVARLKKAQTEGNCTTKSLATLGRIMKLVSDKKPDTMIPYRDSKLTKLLQDTLGSTGKTLLFINICPTEENLFQSKEALKFSLKATL